MAECGIQTGTLITSQSGSQPKRLSNLSLYRIAKGRTRWSIDRESFLLKEGDVLLVLPGQIFSGVESSESVPLRVEWIEVPLCEGSKRLTGSALARALRCQAEDARTLVNCLKGLTTPLIRPNEFLTTSFRQLAGSPKVADDLYRRASVLQLLAGLSRSPTHHTRTPATRRPDAETEVAFFLSELESRCEEVWTLESMAAGAGLKRSRFGTLCRKLTGESPAVYLNRLRIRRSRRLLRDSDLSVTEVALECGFSSSQYFAKTFRRFQGHEPTHYRRLAHDMNLGRGIQYLKGDSGKNVAYASQTVGKGDFEVSGELLLERLGDTAASLEFGDDRFGFDGREGCFFLEGGTFGEARFFNRSADVVREGEFFPFRLKRAGRKLTMTINGKTIFSLNDDPDREIGKVGLRPLRNAVRVQRFDLDGKAARLRVATT